LIKEVGESGGFGAKKWQKWELFDENKDFIS
jgi:hypothetical protein